MEGLIAVTFRISTADADRIDAEIRRRIDRRAAGTLAGSDAYEKSRRSEYARVAVLQRLERDEAAAGNGEGADSRRPRSTSSSPVGEGVPRSPVGGAGGPPRATPARRRRGAVKS